MKGQSPESSLDGRKLLTEGMGGDNRSLHNFQASCFLNWNSFSSLSISRSDDGRCCDVSRIVMVDLENLRRQIFASAVGSITATLALNPIGVLKVRSQAGHGNLPQIVKKILNDSGLLGFWTGARLGMIQSLPSTILYMTSYENIRDFLVQNLPNESRMIAPGIAGGFARSIVVTALAPLELIRMLQLGGSNQSMVEIAREIHGQSGVSGFYRGWASSLMRDTPFSVIYWMCFDQLRGVYGPLLGDRSHAPLINFLSGSTSGRSAPELFLSLTSPRNHSRYLYSPI
jgi:hypothetical protein